MDDVLCAEPHSQIARTTRGDRTANYQVWITGKMNIAHRRVLIQTSQWEFFPFFLKKGVQLSHFQDQDWLFRCCFFGYSSVEPHSSVPVHGFVHGNCDVTNSERWCWFNFWPNNRNLSLAPSVTCAPMQYFSILVDHSWGNWQVGWCENANRAECHFSTVC